MTRLITFFNLKFFVILALVVLTFTLLYKVKASDDLATAESHRADRSQVLAQEQQDSFDKVQVQLLSNQAEILNRYTNLEHANQALLEWLSDNGIKVPAKITKLFVYVPPKAQ